MPDHIAFLGADGSTYVAGNNAYGQLGLGQNCGMDVRRGLAIVPNIPRFSAISTSTNGTYAISEEDGSIWWCGRGRFDSVKTRNFSFTKMPNTTDFVSISCGRNCLIALDSHGKVWGGGSDYSAQLGMDSSQYFHETLIKNPHLRDITSVATGGLHSLVLDVNGIVRTFGCNSWGQLGRQTRWGDKYNTHSFPGPITLQSQAIKISAGREYSLVLDRDFRVWGFGNNSSGQLGLGYCIGSQILKIEVPFDSVDIACAEESSYITDIDGNVWVMGSNYYGQLGFPEECVQFLEESCTSTTRVRKCTYFPQINPCFYQKKLYPTGDSLLIVDQEGFLYGCGSNECGKLSRVEEKCFFELVLMYPENVFSPCLQSNRIKSAGSFANAAPQ